MHDPDYRHFPLVSSYSPSFGSMQNNAAVEEEYEDPFSPMRRSASLTRSPTMRRSASLSSHRDSDQPSPSAAAPMTFVVPTSSPPSSPPMPTSNSPWKRSGRRPPPHQITALDSYFEGAAEEEQESEYDSSEETEQDTSTLRHPRSPGGDPDLSRSESVKRQFQSMSLSVNIKVFRFRRALGARGLQLGLGGSSGDAGRSAAY